MQDASIDLGTWEITADGIREYLEAVGDELAVYEDAGMAPPLMLTARVVGRLLERLSLPDGAIHSLQDVETIEAPRAGVKISATARLEPVRERGGLKFLTVNYRAANADSGFEFQQGRTTVLLPAEASE